MLSDVITIRGPAGTVRALETCAAIAQRSVPDHLRAIVAASLIATAKELVKPVKRTRPAYPRRGGIVVDDAEAAAIDALAGDASNG